MSSTGTVLPLGFETLLDADGHPIPGALIWTFAAGTTTPQATYTDAALLVPNSNPIVADAAGRWQWRGIPGASYKFVYQTAAGVTVLTVDNIASVPAAAANLTATANYRLTLFPGTPITTADVLAASTIYCTPFQGNTLELWDGLRWVPTTFVETALALGTMTAGIGYDVYAYLSGGVVALEKVAWASGVARAVALVAWEGRIVKPFEATRRYLGSFYAASTTTTEDSFKKRYLFNYAHPVPRRMKVFEATANWTYAVAAWRQANAAAANQIEWFMGVEETPIAVRVATLGAHATPNTLIGAAFAIDGAGTPSAEAQPGSGYALVANVPQPLICAGGGYFGLGRHYAAWVEYSGAGTTTFYGSTFAGGITGEVWA